ncbi:MAG: SRPBCC family protein [Bacteroidota bacterium]
MKVFTFKRQILLPVTIAEAWNFFSDPHNLKIITPPEMKFEILTKDLPGRIFSGMIIRYSVSPLFGLKLNWTTKINDVNEPHFFIDEQHKGPYALWQHKHSFSKTGDKTLMYDEVRYSLPLSVFGILANALIVKNKLKKIFDYRSEIILQLFQHEKIAKQ